jgi:hypothetical protein
MNKLYPQHLQDWTHSCVNEAIINLNVVSISGDAAYERLLYGLDQSARRNDGRLCDRYIYKYRHLDYGGWWCNGIDVLTGGESEWGCFKPDKPRTPHQQNKPIKYEHPESVATEIFALRVPDEIWELIADRSEVKKSGGNFWQWLQDNPDVPIVITEGAKKAGALLSQGFAAIALPGIASGYRRDETTAELIPQLKVFCQRWREIIFAFDQDKKYKTKKAVTHSILTTGSLFKELGCKVSVLEWDSKLGKGIDDLIASQGADYLEFLFEERRSLSEYQETKKQKSQYLDSMELMEFMMGEFEDRLSFDEVKSEILLDGKPFILSAELKVWFMEQFGYRCGSEDLVNTALYLAKKNSFNSVQQYLTSVRQNAPRIPIHNLADRYFGLTNPY